jgi:hypothetical protein
MNCLLTRLRNRESGVPPPIAPLLTDWLTNVVPQLSATEERPEAHGSVRVARDPPGAFIVPEHLMTACWGFALLLPCSSL